MSIIQAVIGAVVSGGNYTPPPTYTLTPSANNVDEGASLTFTVGGSNIVDGTYYWRSPNANSSDLEAVSGSVTVTNNYGTFSVTAIADTTTEGAESFTVWLLPTSNGGTILATSTITINDTSVTQTTGSFSFTAQTSQYITLGENLSDWALDKTGTIEWWQKAPNSNSFGGNFNGGMITQGNQGGDGGHGLDIFAAGGNIALGLGGGGVMPYVVEPASTTTWTHVAISFAPNPDNLNVGKSRVYFNGVEQSINNTSVLLTNSTDAIHIGSRVPDANYQNFTGKITNIHISTANLYTSNFTPTIRTEPTTGTVFLMNSSNPTTDLSYGELNNVPVITSGNGNIYVSTSLYPNLDKQIRVGGTITVAGDNSRFTTVRAPVFLSDPAAWGVPTTNTLFQPGVSVNITDIRRHTITGGIYSLSADVVNLHTATHALANGGSSDVWILSNPANDAWAASMPVGATIISQFSGRHTVTSVERDQSGQNWIIGAGTGGYGIFVAGETHTFIW